MEYQSNVLYKTAKADESDEEGDNTENQENKVQIGLVVDYAGQPDIWSGKCKLFCIYRPYRESISKEMNNDNDLNLHSMTKLSG